KRLRKTTGADSVQVNRYCGSITFTYDRSDPGCARKLTRVLKALRLSSLKRERDGRDGRETGADRQSANENHNSDGRTEIGHWRPLALATFGAGCAWFAG